MHAIEKREKMLANSRSHPRGRAAQAIYSFGILVALAIVAITAYEIIAQRADAQSQASRQIAGINVALAEHTERVMAATDFVVADIAKELGKRMGQDGMSAEAADRLLRDRAGNLPMPASLLYADAAGDVLAHTHPQVSSPVSVADRTYFQVQRNKPDAGAYIGEPITGRFTQRPEIVLSRAVVDRHGRFRGVVAAALEANYFVDFYRDVVTPDGGSVVLARADGGVLARYPAAATATGSQAGQLIDTRVVGRYHLSTSVIIEKERLLARWRFSALRLGATGGMGIVVVYWLLAIILRRMGLEARQAERLAESEEQFRTIFDQAADPLFLNDLDGRIVMVNQQACLSLGYGRDELTGKHVTMVDANRGVRQALSGRLAIAAGQALTAETELRRKDGGTFPVEVRLRAFNLGERRLFLVLARDISERKAYQARLEQQANHDMLTGLPNRMLFLDRLQTALAAARRNRRSLTLLFIDLDDFKKINDTLGHRAGDLLLIESGQRIAGVLREADTVARFGGDEFVVLLPEVDGPGDGEHVATKIAAAFIPAFDLAGRPATMRPSIGLARYPDDGEDADSLLSLADRAMYRAKAAARG